MRLSSILAALLLFATASAAADEIDEAANAAATRQWLTEAAARFLEDKVDGLPVYSAQIMEELPSREDYLERGNWCSFYCCSPEIRISASSSLGNSGDLGYAAEMAWDFDTGTAWVEGSEGLGIGESLEFSLLSTAGSEDGIDYSQMYVNGLEIINGYSKSPALHAANGCPLRLKLWFDGRAVAYIDLQDSMGIQEVVFEPQFLSVEHDSTMRLEIIDVRGGSKYADTAISEVVLRGGPCH